MEQTLHRYYLKVSYDGTAFFGSQIQQQLKTVQGTVNQHLSTIFRQEIETFGASRTDEGVHAYCNVYHFDTVQVMDTAKLLYQLNSIADAALSFSELYEVPLTANARFDAISRRYRYKIYFKKDPFKYKRGLFFPYTLNTEVLQETAAILKEYTDFTTFSKKNTQSFTNNCQIFESYWEWHEDELHYVVCANRFLRGMVRALVGTQLKIARSNKTLADFKTIIESLDCNNADFSVTGNGLYLEHIAYPTYELADK